MCKNHICSLILVFVLMGVLGLTIRVPEVEASETIYIRADGSVEGTDKIMSADNVTYVFTDDILDSIVVERGNVVIDGNGYTLQGSGSGNGFYWYNINNVTVKNTTIKNFVYGVYVWLSNNSVVSGNTVTNLPRGISLRYSNNGAVSGNTLTNVTSYGIILDNSGNGIISGNTLTNSTYVGVDIYQSDNGVISGNNITNNGGTGLNVWSSNNCVFSGNTIADSVSYGLYFSGSSSNKIHHNNFVSNSHQAFAFSGSLNNIWDDGYPSGGNYWSDYTDVDDNSGPYQNITGVPDGIWDHAYEISPSDIDHYPFASLYGAQPPAIVILSPENKTYAVNTGISLNFTVSEFTSWIGYSLDGQANVTIIGNTTLPALSDGPHHVFVYANDTYGNMGMATAYFTVDTIPPTADAGPAQTVDEDSVVTFDGSASTDENRIETYTWTFMDVTLKTLSGKNPTYTFATPGVYTITLDVADAAGNTATHTVTITVRDITKPTANAGSDKAINEDVQTTLDGSASTDNVGVAGYTWTFVDVTVKTLIGDKPAYTFSNPGVYTITLNVTDAAGNWATDTVIITVALDATNPVADAGQDQTVNVGATVAFDAGSSTDNVGIVSYEWDFGDGTSGTGKTATHEYTKAGTYTVTLRVEDAAGNQATNTVVVTVTSAEAFPWWILLVASIVAVGIVVAALIFGRRRKKANKTIR